MPMEHGIKEAATKPRSSSPSIASIFAASNDGKKKGDASLDERKERRS